MAKSFVIHRKGYAPIAPQAPSAPSLTGEFSGKTVFFRHGATEIAGMVTEHTKGSNEIEVRLCVPSPAGILMVSDQVVRVKVSDLTARDAAVEARRVAAFTTGAPLEEQESKSFAIKDGNGMITDYRDVTFRAYASTFKHVTEHDRVGDYVLPGAFKETIPEFKKNPVMLIDHVNSVKNIAGSYPDIREDEQGLKVFGSISNAPDMISVRFKLAEKHLRTLSIGGIFIYLPDGFGIEKVYLFETSLVAIPANPDALIDTRSITIEQAVKAFQFAARLAKAA